MNRLLSHLLKLFFLFGMGQAYAEVPRDGLVGEWLFNGDANDSSGNGNIGIVHGAVLTSDRFGNSNQAYNFDGSSYLDLGTGTFLDISTSITLSAWVKHTTGNPSTFENMFMKGNTSYGLQFDQNDNFMFQMYSSGFRLVSSNVKPAASEWYHVVGTYDGSNQKIYIDGQLKNTEAWSGLINVVATTPLTVGYPVASDNHYMVGTVDDIRIYNRALSESEIEQLFNENVVSESCVTLGEGFTQDSNSSGNMFLGENAKYYALSSAKIFGSSGSETVMVAGTPQLELDANIERLELPKNLSDYTFSASGTEIKIYDGSTAVATFMGLNQETTVVFLDGSTELILLGLDIVYLGEKRLSSSATNIDIDLDSSDTPLTKACN
ncbi:concanavalin A-like lectin/glucanases superfamily protein [Oleiphilus messinensis]|uniref:Concanavalin A-like lectin/glucanases superfamily protein n=1 Tax=Oleiphilus messinensis TaxID=141451 RepID=A0A1Y0IFP4_9GAMM|nr:LamG domain-containing protein [Oleiphilus messinensis]ARU59352.1 concanavalin A-like lectin/glucanases superfamily protein [Oleiphilus messinensis]